MLFGISRLKFTNVRCQKMIGKWIWFKIFAKIKIWTCLKYLLTINLPDNIRLHACSFIINALYICEEALNIIFVRVSFFLLNFCKRQFMVLWFNRALSLENQSIPINFYWFSFTHDEHNREERQFHFGNHSDLGINHIFIEYTKRAKINFMWFCLFTCVQSG